MKTLVSLQLSSEDITDLYALKNSKGKTVKLDKERFDNLIAAFGQLTDQLHKMGVEIQ